VERELAMEGLEGEGSTSAMRVVEGLERIDIGHGGVRLDLRRLWQS
jgi:hypothetical protein